MIESLAVLYIDQISLVIDEDILEDMFLFHDSL